MIETEIDSEDFLVDAREESLFARGIDGQLIRAEKATIEDFTKDIHLTIDGMAVTVKKTVPTLNAQGEIIRDALGVPIPRFSTIYDAASQLFIKKLGDANPIPTLCHREHLNPVGVCRVCIVEIVITSKRGTRSQFVPSCTYRVAEGMEVHTHRSDIKKETAQRLRSAIRTLLELLATDQLSPDQIQELETPASTSNYNELARLCREFGVLPNRFQRRPSVEQRRRDLSQMIAVNHESCILCERCIRSCNDLKGNNVIGRVGKGYNATIGFDLNDSMGESSCVSCGECAISCPTDALTIRPEVVERQIRLLAESRPQAEAKTSSDKVLSAQEMLASHPIFAGIPIKFMEFNGGACVRRKLQPGEVLCREGEYGATAFIILSGRFEIFLDSKRSSVKTTRASGIRGFFGGLTTFLAPSSSSEESDRSQKQGVNALKHGGRLYCTPEDVLLGEMACLNRYPRSATVTAVEPSEVLEIRRNVLSMLLRNKSSRELLDRAYRKRAVNFLETMEILKPLPDTDRKAAASFLRDRVELLRIDPGQVIFRQGNLGDDMFLVRLGYVKVAAAVRNSEQVLNYIGPGGYFGEIAAIASLELSADFQAEEPSLDPRRRTASCSALDHVELVRISRETLVELVANFPILRDHLRQRANSLLEGDRTRRKRLDTLADDFLEQGLFNAQSLLVIDLEACTRCDECSKACADTHSGVTRLIREGLRFDKFLVASSCRSCQDPYCLVGCPVDAIHRKGTSEIVIEDHCIGCGLCAQNCPYGNINMHSIPASDAAADSTNASWKATTCDLCRDAGGTPSCVYACPHNAAFRLTGPQLLRMTDKK